MTDEPAANEEQTPRNWKLLLRYGRLKTRYQHFTVFVDVQVIEPHAGVRSHVGPAWMGMKVWAPSADAAAEMICGIAPQVGAEVRGRCEVYTSEPDEPPQDTAYAYDLRFTAYGE